MENLTNQRNALLLEINSNLDNITNLFHNLDLLEANLLKKERHLNQILKKLGCDDRLIDKVYEAIANANAKDHTSLFKRVDAILPTIEQ